MVDISDIHAKTTVAQAQQKARQFVTEFKKIKSLQPPLASKGEELARSANNAVTQRFQLPIPRNAFIYELASAFGGVAAVMDFSPLYDSPQYRPPPPSISPEDVVPINSVDDLNFSWVQRNSHFGKVWLPATAAIVVPVTDLFPTRGGETVTVNFQVFREESESTSTERYVDVYVSKEVGAKIPVVSVLTVDIKQGVKVGEKEANQTAVKQATRTAKQISKIYVMEKIGRNCLIYAPFMVSAIGNLWTQLGWRIQPKDGGDAIGPWLAMLHLNGHFDDVDDETYRVASSALKKIIEEDALVEAKHAAVML